jgi:hypothetical protein
MASTGLRQVRCTDAVLARRAGRRRSCVIRNEVSVRSREAIVSFAATTANECRSFAIGWSEVTLHAGNEATNVATIVATERLLGNRGLAEPEKQHVHEEPPRHGAPHRGTVAQHQPRMTGIERIEAELPHPLEAVARSAEDERALRRPPELRKMSRCLVATRLPDGVHAVSGAAAR